MTSSEATSLTDASPTIHSRFSGLPVVSTVPQLLGLACVDTAGEDVLQNAVRIPAGEYVLPDGRGSWSLLYSHAAAHLTGEFAHNSLPIESDIESVVSLIGRTSVGDW